MSKNQLFLLLGTNLGDKKQNLITAIKAIEDLLGKVESKSKIYETAAWGITDQPSFLNQVLQIETNLAPTKVLKNILQIETEMGRIRANKWGARLIDIDILYIGNETIRKDDLIVPHPYLHERRFTLMPLVEIAADFIHPIFNKSNSQLLNECGDKGEVVLIEN
ncbi:MAG: 2-amino-4-hydroxy-6-hydroxymethyldihydropteridine diphosphokinase [Bacteroidota bacterium]